MDASAIAAPTMDASTIAAPASPMSTLIPKKFKRLRVEDLYCHEPLSPFRDASLFVRLVPAEPRAPPPPAAPLPLPKAPKPNATTLQPTKTTATESKKPSATKKKKKRPTKAAPAIRVPPPMEVPTHIQHVPLMYSRRALKLGQVTGSAAWNQALKEQLWQTQTAVPHLSAVDCLSQVRAKLQIATLVPDKDSPLHLALKSRTIEDDPPGLGSLAQVYRTMVEQELDLEHVQDDLYLLSSEQLRRHMIDLENRATALEQRQARLAIERPPPPKVARLRGLVRDE